MRSASNGMIRRVVVGLGLLLAPDAAAAQEEPAVGSALSDHFVLAGKQVALPEGTWTLAGRSFEAAPQMAGDAYGAIETVVLFRADAPLVEAFVVAQRNVVPIEEGWGTASECLGEEVEPLVAVTWDTTLGHAFCGFVAAVRPAVTSTSPGAWQDAAAYGQSNGLGPAPLYLMAGYRLSDPYDVLDVRYHFDAALAGDRIDAATPVAGRLDEDDPAIADLANWLSQMRDLVRLGFRNGLGELPPMPMPWTLAADDPSPLVAAKLTQLEALRRMGAIGEQQFHAQQARILSQEQRVVGEQLSNEALTAIKVGVEQITAAVPLLAGNYWVLGNLPDAATLLGIQTVADIVHDYGTEWAWNTYGPQRLREAPTVDLPVAGRIVD